MDKLEILNKIPAVDYSCVSKELEYVQIENIENNRKILRSLGVEEEELSRAIVEEEDVIDIVGIACNFGAVGWQKGYGFLTEEQAKELGLEWAE